MLYSVERCMYALSRQERKVLYRDHIHIGIILNTGT